MKSYKKINNGILDKKLIKSLVFGVLCGIIITTLLTVICSVVLLIMGSYPSESIKFISLAFLGIGGLIGGYVSARLNKAAGLVVGGLTGLIIFLIVLIAGLSASFGTVTLFTLYKLIVLVIFSALGGVLGVNKQKKVKI